MTSSRLFSVQVFAETLLSSGHLTLRFSYAATSTTHNSFKALHNS